MSETKPPADDELDEVAIEPVSRNEAKRIHEISPLDKDLAENLNKPGALIPGLGKMGTMAMKWVSRQIFRTEAQPAKTESPFPPPSAPAETKKAPEPPKASDSWAASRSTFFNTGAIEETTPIGDYGITVTEVRRLLDEDQAGKALPLAQDLAVRHPENPEPRLLIASCFLGIGEASRAAPILDALSREETASAETFLKLGEARKALGDERQAKMAFLRCLELSPSEGVARRAREQLGGDGLSCERCGKKIGKEGRSEVAGRWVCHDCGEVLRAELAEQVKQAQAGDKATIVDLRRKAKKQRLIKIVIYVAVLALASMAAMFFVKADWYMAIRQRLGLIGKYLPTPPSLRGKTPSDNRGAVRPVTEIPVPDDEDEKESDPPEQPSTPAATPPTTTEPEAGKPEPAPADATPAPAPTTPTPAPAAPATTTTPPAAPATPEQPSPAPAPTPAPAPKPPEPSVTKPPVQPPPPVKPAEPPKRPTPEDDHGGFIL